MNMGVLDSDFISFDYIPRSGIAKSYFNFLRNLHTIYHMPIPIYDLPNSIGRGSHFLHLCQNLLFSAFFHNRQLTILRWYFILPLSYVSLMINIIEHVFIYLFTICMSFKKSVISSLYAYFIIRWFDFCYWVVWAPYIFWILTLLWIYQLQIFFLPFCKLEF